MCILRYLPATLPSASNTTAVLWYRPVARFSNSELTSTTPCCLASGARRSVLGPGMVSARSNSHTSSCWQKYGPLCSSCSSTSLAPRLAASATRCSITDRFASASPWLRSWISATGRVVFFIVSPDIVVRARRGRPPIVGRAHDAHENVGGTQRTAVPSAESGDDALRQLHRDAVQAAVLPDQRAARDLDDFAARKGFGEHGLCLRIGLVAVGR